MAVGTAGCRWHHQVALTASTAGCRWHRQVALAVSTAGRCWCRHHQKTLAAGGDYYFLFHIRHQPLASTFFPGKNVHAPPAGSPGLP
jgi:hypothetical protein